LTVEIAGNKTMVPVNQCHGAISVTDGGGREGHRDHGH
jgi:hypothetical protein